MTWIEPGSARGCLAVTSADGASHAVAADTWQTTTLHGPDAATRTPTQAGRTVTPDGTRILELGGAHGDELTIRDAARNEALLTLQLPSAGSCVTVSADSRVLAAGLADGRVAAWVSRR